MLISSYNPKEMGDILVVITAPDDGSEQTTKVNDGVAQITNDKGQLLGYNFLAASETLPELKDENGQVFLSEDQVAKLNQKLAAAGFAQELTADLTSKFIVGYVEKLEDHPKSDHLKITQTRISADQTVQIVCGSPNVAEGIKVVVARPGAMMPDGKIIWPGALMGVESDGMLCGFRELRLKNAPDKKGLWIIPDDWQEVGEAVDFDRANTFFPAK
ncbi:YtpR family tRNA-binding protein [Limosilactobacillus sp.]|uniref:YtpR family tRNA-binding protein n=1 Tax=Limosilactobacillus sp. TaxID=2773925 RepID=UPI003F0BD3F0